MTDTAPTGALQARSVFQLISFPGGALPPPPLDDPRVGLSPGALVGFPKAAARERPRPFDVDELRHKRAFAGDAAERGGIRWLRNLRSRLRLLWGPIPAVRIAPKRSLIRHDESTDCHPEILLQEKDLPFGKALCFMP